MAAMHSDVTTTLCTNFASTRPKKRVGARSSTVLEHVGSLATWLDVPSGSQRLILRDRRMSTQSTCQRTTQHSAAQGRSSCAQQICHGKLTCTRKYHRYSCLTGGQRRNRRPSYKRPRSVSPSPQ